MDYTDDAGSGADAIARSGRAARARRTNCHGALTACAFSAALHRPGCSGRGRTTSLRSAWTCRWRPRWSWWSACGAAPSRCHRTSARCRASTWATSAPIRKVHFCCVHTYVEPATSKLAVQCALRGITNPSWRLHRGGRAAPTAASAGTASRPRCPLGSPLRRRTRSGSATAGASHDRGGGPPAPSVFGQARTSRQPGPHTCHGRSQSSGMTIAAAHAPAAAPASDHSSQTSSALCTLASGWPRSSASERLAAVVGRARSLGRGYARKVQEHAHDVGRRLENQRGRDRGQRAQEQRPRQRPLGVPALAAAGQPRRPRSAAAAIAAHGGAGARTARRARPAALRRRGRRGRRCPTTAPAAVPGARERACAGRTDSQPRRRKASEAGRLRPYRAVRDAAPLAGDHGGLSGHGHQGNARGLHRGRHRLCVHGRQRGPADGGFCSPVFRSVLRQARRPACRPSSRSSLLVLAAAFRPPPVPSCG